MSIVHPQKFGTALCNAIGIDANGVARITIDVEPGSVPTIDVTVVTDQIVADEIVTELHRYDIREHDTADLIPLLESELCDLGHGDHGHTDCWHISETVAELRRRAKRNPA